MKWIKHRVKNKPVLSPLLCPIFETVTGRRGRGSWAVVVVLWSYDIYIHECCILRGLVYSNSTLILVCTACWVYSYGSNRVYHSVPGIASGAYLFQQARLSGLSTNHADKSDTRSLRLRVYTVIRSCGIQTKTDTSYWMFDFLESYRKIPENWYVVSSGRYFTKYRSSRSRRRYPYPSLVGVVWNKVTYQKNGTSSALLSHELHCTD